MTQVNDNQGECEQSPVHLAGSVLGPSRHVCAFFSSDEDHHRTLLPFIKEGFERGEKVLFLRSREILI